MSEGVYGNSDGVEDNEPDAMKNTDIDGQLYANVRAINISPRDGVVASVHFQWWKRPSAVCLGLLCVLLMAGIIGLSAYYGVIGHHNSTERNQLQTSNNNLTEERDQLQTSYNNLTKERDQLQTERDFLSGRLTNCGWQKFESRWYFLSTETKTWNKSREDCLERGADLVIINSDKKQEFLFKLKKRVWIGLTDSVTEGTWRWVDGTPLTTPRYWNDNQPDSGDPSGEEDCVEIHKDWISLKAWNDMPCDKKLNWICEKVF
ncbi:CD209 antigen-like protein C isoform X5 [Salvelinus sp. IW2-2015]|uniref:CD209 antigen-like protein C isoform X5 n=1 Tax=Salvelinus sp. IW2-2015 TaxID=2691554 RepID=UPI0038D411C8